MTTSTPRRDVPEVLTLAEAAHYLRTSDRSVRRLAESGALPFFRLPGMTTRYVRLDDLRGFVAELVKQHEATRPIDPLRPPENVRRIA